MKLRHIYASVFTVLIFLLSQSMAVATTPTPTLTPTTTPTPRIDFAGDGIRFVVEDVEVFFKFNNETPSYGILIYFRGALLASQNRCIHGYDFKLSISGRDYEPSTYWMDRLKPYAGNIDYPGWWAGLCMDANVARQTFVVFEVPPTGSTANLKFFDGVYSLGMWSDIVPTPTPTNTRLPTNTLGPTRTPLPTRTPSDTPPPSATRTPTPQDYTATSNGNLRSCPQTTCEIVGTVAFGERLKVIGSEQGASVSGSSTWLIIQRDGKPNAYLHDSIARAGTPRPAPLVNNTSRPASTQQLASTAAPAQTWNCSGDRYNCNSFSSRAELMSYFNTCPGDPSRLDRDNDGIPCE